MTTKNLGCEKCIHYKYGMLYGVICGYCKGFGCSFWADKDKFHPITGEKILNDYCQYHNKDLDCKGFKKKLNFFEKITQWLQSESEEN